MALLASLPFDMFYSHVILISLVIHTLIHFKRQDVLAWQVILLQSVFFVTLLGTLYTANRQEAYQEWGKQATILVFPLLFCYTSLDLKKYRTPLLLTFSLVCTAVTAYLYVDAFMAIRYYHLGFSSLFSAAFINHNFSAPIGMHATFLSMQLAIAVVCLIQALMNEKTLYLKLFYAVCIGILCGGLVQLCSKSVCFCLFLILTIAVPWFLLARQWRWKFVLVTGSLFIVSILLVSRLSIFKERYLTELGTDLSRASAGETEDPRLSRWGAALELIAGAPVIGHGTGSEIALLQQSFFEKKYYNSYLHRLNAHNQYLSFLVKSGVAGLLVYLAVLIFGLRLSLLKKDLPFFSFMLLIALVSVSENVLDVNKGIMFYGFFLSFFVYSAMGKKQEMG